MHDENAHTQPITQPTNPNKTPQHTKQQDVGLAALLHQAPSPQQQEHQHHHPQYPGLSVVADWGRRLSRGERQRVALARALYHEPKVGWWVE